MRAVGEGRALGAIERAAESRPAERRLRAVLLGEEPRAMEAGGRAERFRGREAR